MPLNRITPLAFATGLLLGGLVLGGAAHGQTEPIAAVGGLEPSIAIRPPARGNMLKRLPIVLQARQLSSQPDLLTLAEGDVELRTAGMVVRGDRMSYDSTLDLARASGHVSVTRLGAVYSGQLLELKVQRFEGFFLQPEFEYPLLGSGGRADRIDFFDNARSQAQNALYTSCPRDGPDEPAWVLKADRVRIDLEANEGIADGAVLRFLGVPIIAAPSLSFPISDSRRSGWLPPSISLDNRSGAELTVPYYWNLAPQRDATIAPRVITRRGLGVDGEFRYLEATDEGRVATTWLPHDKQLGRSRQSVQWQHDGNIDIATSYHVDLVRVSDHDWWKDFPNDARGLTARLLPMRLSIEHRFGGDGASALAYARAERWQVLQTSDALIVGPYQRSPQVGLRLDGSAGLLRYASELEYNRFTLTGDEAPASSTGNSASTTRKAGERVHLLGSVSLPLREPGWWLVPKMAVNAAHYSDTGAAVDSRTSAGRVIPTFSTDAGLELERRIEGFGRPLLQSLEPRLLYVRTPYRLQSRLPNYDSAGKDFNFTSIYTDNAFSGVDRVSDANQLTAGVTTRLVDAISGAEALRLGIVQRYLFSTQQVTPQSDGTADGAPLEQRFSDVLLLGSTSVFPAWTLDAALQYNSDLQRSVRTIAGARYSPGPFRTVSVTYRLARGLSEQVELGWQWPILQARQDASRTVPASRGSGCPGSWYSVGRLNYSLQDKRTTDSIVGVEYDSGCWIGRVVAERLSTGRSEATNRLLVQLELVGLSRIGSNPLRVLKENIPGYRLLREERRGLISGDDPSATTPHD